MRKIKPDVPLYLWESFIAVIEERTLQKAAVKIKTTQPTITRHLHQLEESLPLQLFELRGRTKVPTPFALELYKNIHQRLNGLSDDVQSSVHNHGQSQHSRLKIGGRKDVLDGVADRISFKGELVFNVIKESDDETEALKENYDILFLHHRVNDKSYLSGKLKSLSPVILIPKKFYKKDRRKVSLKEKLTAYPLALYSRQHPLFKDIPMGDIQMEYADWGTLERRAAKGLSWTIVPRHFARTDADYLIEPLINLEKKSSDYETFVYYKKSLQKIAWFKPLLSQLI